MPRNLASRLRMIVHAPQMISVRHRCKGTVERQDLESMTRKIELANNLGTQQRHDVRAHRKLEAGKDLFGYGGAAEHVPALKYEHALARTREVCGVDQPVVAAADYNDFVFVTHD